MSNKSETPKRSDYMEKFQENIDNLKTEIEEIQEELDFDPHCLPVH